LFSIKAPLFPDSSLLCHPNTFHTGCIKGCDDPHGGCPNKALFTGQISRLNFDLGGCPNIDHTRPFREELRGFSKKLTPPHNDETRFKPKKHNSF